MKKLLLFSITFIGISIFSTSIVNGQGVGINSSGNAPDPSAILDASSTTKGTLITRMTTAQRDAISNPAQSLLIFNTTTNCFEAYVSGAWYSLSCPCPLPSAPLSGTSVPNQTQIVWNWNSVSGATGYKWGTTNIYSSASDNGSNTSYTQTGLTCNTPYTLYVWAYNSCGNSSTSTLTQTTSSCALSQFCLAVGGSGGDVGQSGIKTSDGGYAVAGYTTSFGAGNTDVYIVKLDGSGTVQWTRTVGGTGDEEASSIVQTGDGGYAVAGYTNSFGAGNDDFYIVKLDGSGTVQWTRTVGGTGAENAYSIAQTGDGGCAVSGRTTSFGAGFSDNYIVKLDGSGTVQWTRTVGGSTENDYGNSIIQTSDGGYAVGGNTNSFGSGNADFYVVKLDGSGTVQWTRTVGGIGDEVGFSIVQTGDGGYAVAGYTNSFGAGNDDVYIVKLNGSGTVQWTRTVGGTGPDYTSSIVQTADGGYAVAGNTTSFGTGNTDVYIVKLDGSGMVQWTRTVGGAGSENGRSIFQTGDGGYAVAGYTNSFGAGSNDVYIVKLNNSAPAATCCTMNSGGASNSGGTSNSGAPATAGAVPEAGGSSGSGGTRTLNCSQ